MKRSLFVSLINFTFPKARGFAYFVHTLMPVFTAVVVLCYV